MVPMCSSEQSVHSLYDTHGEKRVTIWASSIMLVKNQSAKKSVGLPIDLTNPHETGLNLNAL